MGYSGRATVMGRQHSYARSSSSGAGGLARALGWLSLGVGIVELIAPRRIARGLGMRDQQVMVRAYGVRELVTGAGLLMSKNPGPWMWARVLGDMLDLATLARASHDYNPRRSRVMMGLATVAGVSILDLVAAVGLSMRQGGMERVFDYSDRSGWPRPVEAMRGLAKDFLTPRDMRGPEVMRRYLPV